MRLCSNATLLFALLPIAGPVVLRSQTVSNALLSSPVPVSVSPVLVGVTVTDQNGKLVTGLGKDAFTVLEDSRPQTIQSISADDAPCTIGILLDLSASVSQIGPERAFVDQFLRFSNADDQFFVVGFSEHPQLIADLASSRPEIERSLAAVQIGHKTSLYDAVFLGLEKLKEARYPRRVLVIVSDGADNFSRHSEKDVDAALRRSQVEVFSFGLFNPRAASIGERNGPEVLGEFSHDTGGGFSATNDPSDLVEIAPRWISSEIRQQYLLTYVSDSARPNGGWRKLKVKLSPQPKFSRLTVHARTGYYAPLQ